MKLEKLSGLAFWVSVVLLGLFFWSQPARAQRMKLPSSDLDHLTISKPELVLNSRNQDINLVRAEMAEAGSVRLNAVLAEYDRLMTDTGLWKMEFDRITGRPGIFEGGLPFIPGRGNTLTASDVGVTEEVASVNQIPLEVVHQLAMDFIHKYPDLLSVDSQDLQMSEGSGGPIGDYLYYLWYNWTYKGIPVEKASVVFRFNNGNLVQFGQEYICDSIEQLDPNPSISGETAWQVLWGYLGGTSSEDSILEPGRLLIVPVHSAEGLTGQQIPMGTGLNYRLTYILAFHREGVLGNWEARVDAHTGELISFKDTNAYGHIQGGTYKTDKPFNASNPPSYANPQTESSMPFPYANYSGTSTYSDGAGNFPGTTGTSTLTGRYVRISDNCGAISLGADAGGLIDFGTYNNTLDDCSASGVGGAGNTHSSRTQYWNVTQIKLKAMMYLPSNTWLQGQLTDNVNINQVCNAYWSSSSGTVNFFRSGRYTSGSFWMDCNNTGELPGVSLHEFGHGLDRNDGNSSSPDPGTGETYGDLTAILQTHESCAGGGFLQNISSGSTLCGYGTDACTSCTGVRDIDYAKHSPATPATPANYSGNSAVCPLSSVGCDGPCGRECHCESAPSSQTIWDLAVRDLTASPYSMDSASAWQLVDKLWYLSRPTAAGAFTCNMNGNDGCGTNSYYKVFRVADDCDGILTNGTPHAGAIWAAFNRHGIGCSTDVRTDDSCPACPSLTATALSGTAGNNSNSLTWSAVTGAASYDVLRNETSCSAGFTIIANVTTTSYTDALAVNGITYYYRIQAKATGSCPAGPLSNCLTLTPSPCTTPGTPTIGAATIPGDNQIQVTWTPGSPAGSTYRLYRAILPTPGTDCATGTYSYLAPDTASPYLDTTVSGGSTYGYRVSAVDSTGGCESLQSGCVKATATGACTAPPAFAGLTSVTNAASATCTLNLTWSAGASNCAGTVTYNVYRSETSGFTPGAGNRIASGVTATSYLDTDQLVNGTTYYYIVRAVDSFNAMEDGNTVQQSGAPTGPVTQANLADDFEAAGGFDLAGWTHSAISGTVDWVWSTTRYNTPTHSWFSASEGTASDRQLITPSFGVLPTTTLSFYHTYAFENSSTCYDGGTLEYATAPSYSTWTVIPDAYFTSGGFNGTVYSGSSNPMAGKRAWCGGTIGTMTQVQINLASLNGQVIKVRWHEGDDLNTVVTGWYVDTVRINNAGTAGTCTTGSPCTPPSQPSLNSATGTCAGVDLTWGAGGGTLSYNVYRKSEPCGGTYTKIAGPITETTYQDTSAMAGTTYAYVVRGACDPGGSTESADSNCLTAARLVSPSPTITCDPSGCANVCPSTSVTLTTQSGMSSYQWFRDGSPAGSGSSTLVATQSGIYTVSYTNTDGCSGTSAGRSVTITACQPNVVYYTHSGPTEVSGQGDGDGVMEAGEKWQITVTVTNSGNTAATNVAGSLSGEGLLVCNNPGSFGTVGVGETTDQYTFQFIPDPSAWYGTYSCGSSIGFDLVSKSSDGGAYTYASDTDFATRQVGQSGGTVDLFPPDDFTNLINWTQNPAGSTTLTTSTHCSHSSSYARLSGQGTILSRAQSTAGYTNIQVLFDRITTGMDSGEYLYLEWYDGATWITAWSGAPATWECGITPITLTAGANNNPAFQLRFRNNASNGNERAGVDYVTLRGQSTANCGTGSASCTTLPRRVPFSVQPTQLTSADHGASGTVTWDATNCASADYHVVWGWGSGLPIWTIQTSPSGPCNMGTDGTQPWPSIPNPPAGDFLWFVVVGDDGTSTEGSWGLTSAGAERGTGVSGVCGIASKDTTTTCGTE